MYAVISTGGKQYRVAEGQRLDVEQLTADEGGDVSFTPVLVVDGETVLATPGDLSGAAVRAQVVGETKGPKIKGFTYKPKSNNRRRWGHRQHYATILITGIDVPARQAGGQGPERPIEAGNTGG
ncbi:MAG: 50S ribosomal protein L21 [Actinomycetota bacterium]|nr:50S ribosomal protein L21 [Actinomycetota bacterium]